MEPGRTGKLIDQAEGFPGPTGHRLVALRTRRYLEALRWLVVSVARFRPLRTTVIIGLVAAGRTMQAAAFAAIIWYFTSLEGNLPIDVLGRSFEPRTGMTMAAVVAAVTAALVAATFVIYLSARLSLDLSMSFAGHVIESVLSLEHAFPSRMALSRNGRMSLQAFQLTNARIELFRPVNTLLALPRNLLLAIPAIAGMIWISGKVVAFLLVLAVPAIALNYIISHRVVVSQREFKEAQNRYRAEARRALRILGEEWGLHADRPSIPQRLIGGESSRTAVETFSVRILSPAKSEFVSNVLSAIAVASIGVYLGHAAIAGTIPLALVIGFFVLLRLTVSGLTGIAMSLTSYARFYEVVRSAYEYLTSPVPRPEKLNARLVLHAAGRDLPVPGALDQGVPVGRGAPVAVVSPAELNRFTQYYFAFALTQRGRHATRRRLNASTLRCATALAEPANLSLHGLSGLSESDLASRVAAAGLAEIAPSFEEIQAAAAGAEKPRRRTRARIGLLTAVLSTCELVLVDARLARHLSREELQRWLESLSDRYVAVAYGLDLFAGCIAGESHAILLDAERAVAVVEAGDAIEAAAVVRKNLKPVREDEEGDLDDET